MMKATRSQSTWLSGSLTEAIEEGKFETIEEIDRIPSCVRTCPANARHYGDLSDPLSDVSVMVAERGGMDLMPEQGTRPVNKYLPPRPRTSLASSAGPLPLAENTDGDELALGCQPADDAGAGPARAAERRNECQ